jgi:hypothetical protein
VADVPSGLSLTPPRKTKKKNHIDNCSVVRVFITVSFAYTIFPLSHFVALYSSLILRVGWSVRDPRVQFNPFASLLCSCRDPLIDN